MNETRPCPLCGTDAEYQYIADGDTHAIGCDACGYYRARGDLAQFDPLTAKDRRYIAGMNRNLNRYNCHCRYRDGARRYLRDFATVERIARAYGFAGADIEASGGCEGKTFIIADGDRRYTLRMYSDIRDRIRSELLWLASLRDADIGALEPVPAPDGESILPVGDPANPDRVYAVLYRWIEGLPVQILPDEQRTPELFGRFGEFVARIHEHGRGFAPPEWFVAPHCDADTVRQRVADAEDDETRTLGAQLLPLLDALGAEARGIVHNDLTWLNILYDDGAFSAIDWAGFGRGYFASDLSRLLVDGMPEELYAPLVDGYRRVRPLPDAFTDHLGVFSRAQEIGLF